MFKLFRMIRFMKAAAAAIDQCHDKLVCINGWPITFIGRNDSYHVKAGIVTESDAYEALRLLYDKVHKELDRYRSGKGAVALAWFVKYGFRKAT